MSDDRPTLVGIGRDAENEKSLVLYLDKRPSDEIMREIHDTLIKERPVVAYQVCLNRKHKPDQKDDWGPWRNIHEENVDLYKRRMQAMPGLVKMRALIERD